MVKRKAFALALALVLLLSAGAGAQDSPLSQSFQSPPASAQPRVWWHWMNGNITRAGIDADLEWMNRVGIAGVQNFDAALDTPQFVERRLAYLTPEWREAFHHAVTKADRLGLEFSIAGSPGWSMTGGPWVKPEQAMKKLVWSETDVTGGRPFTGRLALPPTIPGPFQDMPAADVPKMPTAPNDFYRDALVVAYRQPAVEIAPLTTPKLTASAPVDLSVLSDGELGRALELPFAPDAESWIMADFGQPQSLRAITIASRRKLDNPFRNTVPEGRIEVSDDGRDFRAIVHINFSLGAAPQRTTAFSATKARYFRIVFLPHLHEAEHYGIAAPTVHPLAELRFEQGARVHRFEDKAGWSAGRGIEQDPTPAMDTNAAIRAQDIVDLTSRLQPDGSLEWTPPPGRWKVLRLGYSLTGMRNHPASPEATGLEVDKLDREHVRTYLDAYLAEYEKTLGRSLLGGRGLRYMIVDSYESGPQNWTDEMRRKFKTRRGYDLARWAPVLTGRVVQSADSSERFLWDFRRTLADLLAQEHYGQVAESLHDRGMGLYAESHEVDRVMVADGMEVKKAADIPMGSMWAAAPWGADQYDADIRETASVAHVYGQNIVAAESFTSIRANDFGFSPEMLKPVADRMLLNGLNRFVIHTSVHQPVNGVGPGVTLGPFGQWFTRNETWAEQAGAWTSYLARASHLLQQGTFAADIAWFYGEDSNVVRLYTKRLPQVPSGYAYDFVNADALRNQLSVANGRIVSRSGMSYRVLVLDPAASRMTLPVLRKIRELVAGGATVVGAKPTGSPSLMDDKAAFDRTAEEIWGGRGKGKVFAHVDVAMQSLGLRPDFTSHPKRDAVGFVHRRLHDGDIYFLANRSDQTVAFDGEFRIIGKIPELWRAEDGSRASVSYRTDNGSTVVPLILGPSDSVFVVFDHDSTTLSRTIVEAPLRTEREIDGPWRVTFESGRGAPEHIDLPALMSLSEHADPGVKYFSGVATYRKRIQVASAALTNGRVMLDLGTVKNLAEVVVNGRSVGVAWKQPFRVDITDAMHAGENEIVIKVANLWVNRLIGDQQATARKIAVTTFNPYTANSALPPSGLLGPVRLLTQQRSTPAD